MNENYYSLLEKKKAGVAVAERARVYFACHPDDMKDYFDSMFEEIQGIHSCIFYYLNPDVPDPRTDKAYLDKHRADLKEMQLMIVPVTEKFLTEPSLARDHDIEFAVQNQIPLLPVMQGLNLLELYNSIKTLNGIHFFDKNSSDSTSLSYEEKLKRFIETVFVSDERLKEIDGEFSNKIFLSYRKVDRFFAQELMQKIHSFDSCRDVAIWYDEFLTPGEQFSTEIEERIASSDLFAMVVTPNISIKPNYVEQYEYRYAQKEKMDIIAAEFVKTDRKSLEQAFDEFPGCVDGNREGDILETLKNYGIGGDDLPENSYHLFLIGLAYLNGIQVEINRRKAVELITRAANMSDDPYRTVAMKKLSEMYYFGIGVPKSYSEADKWQKALVEAYEQMLKVCRENSDCPTDILEEFVALYLTEYTILGDYAYDEDDYEKCDKYYESIGDAVAALVMGKKGQINPAFDGIKLTAKLAARIWDDCTRCFTRLSLHAHMRGEAKQAAYYLECEEKVDEALEKLMSDSGLNNEIDQNEMTVRINNLVKETIRNERNYKKCWNSGKYREGAEYCVKNAKLNEDLISDFGEAGTLNDDLIAQSMVSMLAWYSRAGNMMYQAGNYDVCYEYMCNSIRCYEVLGGNLDVFNNTDYYMDVWIDYLMMGQSLVLMFESEAAIKYLRKALDVCSEIYKRIPSKHWEQNLKNTMTRLRNQESLYAMHNNFWDQVLKSCEEENASAPREDSKEPSDSKTDGDRTGGNGENSGDTSLKSDESSPDKDSDKCNMNENGNDDDGEEKLYPLYQFDLSSKSIEELIKLYDKYMLRGDILLLRKNYPDAVKMYDSCITCEKEIRERRNNVLDKWYHAFALEGRATCQMRVGDYPKALETYDKTAVLCTELLKETEHEEAMATLAKSFSNMAMACSKLKLGKKVSDKFFNESKKVWKKAYRKYKKPQYKAKIKEIAGMKEIF